jgi:hypothetical protein
MGASAVRVACRSGRARKTDAVHEFVLAPH